MENKSLNDAFSALADPTRREIVAALHDGPLTVNALAARLPVSQPAVSKHLKVLEAAGVIERDQIGTSRPARLKASAFVQLDAWLDRYRDVREAQFMQLDAVLDDLKKD